MLRKQTEFSKTLYGAYLFAFGDILPGMFRFLYYVWISKPQPPFYKCLVEEKIRRLL